MNTPTETQAVPGPNSSCLVIKTGRIDCHANFYPALYQLTLVKAGSEEKVDLGYSGSRLLERLLRTPGEVVAREELMNHAWSDRVVGQGSLNQQVYTLRQVLADERTREIIQTLPRRGYLFNPNYLMDTPDLADDGDDEADDDGTPTPTERQPSPHHRHVGQTSLAMLVGLVLLGLGLLGYAYQANSPTRLLASELNIGKASVAYLGEDKHVLQQLILRTHGLSSRMAGLADQPVELILGMASGFYEVLCLQPGGGVRSLLLHESQLGSLADEQLRRCLP